MRQAKMKGVLLAGTHKKDSLLLHTNFNSAITDLLAMKYVDMTGVKNIMQKQINTMFGDGTVKILKGRERPCHWGKKDLKTEAMEKFGAPDENDAFIGRWRWWVEANSGVWPTSKRFANFENVKAIKPPKRCPLIVEMNYESIFGLVLNATKGSVF